MVLCWVAITEKGIEAIHERFMANDPKFRFKGS
jgi:hypothetical protein